MQLDLGECRVRHWRSGDETSLARNANDREIWRNLRDLFPHPYKLSDAVKWIGGATAEKPLTQFAVEVDGEAVGGIGFLLGEDVYRRSAEIGFWLGKAFWGRGIMTEVVREVTDRAFAEFVLCRVFAAVFEWNPASMRVLEKAGYQREGCLRKSVTKAGKTVDSIIYAKIRE